MKKRAPRDIGFSVLVVIVLLSAVYLLAKGGGKSTKQVEYSVVRRLFINKQVESYKLTDQLLEIKLKAPIDELGTDTVTHELYSLEVFENDNREYIDKLVMDNIDNYDEVADYKYGMRLPWWVSLIPSLAMIVGVLFFLNVMMNRSVGGDKGAGRTGRARTRLASDEKKKVTFADVAGADEEKAELSEIIDFLKDPSRYTALGARIPTGVLLVGPPGTGKTLIAKAVAGEAGVQFLSISGSDFVELYVGVGAARVRDLFEQAKKLAPAIIFIDEIDAVGRQRGTGLGGNHDEREQTLNQLLVEMDGFTTNEGVIVIAATNRSDILDNALLRPGRFDRQVYVGLPDAKGREEILKVHSRGKLLAEDVVLKHIAKTTIGFTGADLENLLNEAALLTVRSGKRAISMREMDEATLKVLAGPEKKSRIVTEHDRRLTAYHEAGHAVSAFYLNGTDPVHHISIIPRGRAGGLTLYRPTDDRAGQSRNEMLARIVTALGGRIAEKLMLDDISTGASSDIQSATAIARAMVTQYGMSDALGPISYDDASQSVFIGRDFSNRKGYSEKTAALIDEEVKRIFDNAITTCERILTEHREQLIATAEYLLVHETMDGDQFKALCETGAVPEIVPEPVYNDFSDIEPPKSDFADLEADVTDEVE